MRRSLPALLIVVAVCLQAVGFPLIGWMCEGRACSTDIFRCCCDLAPVRQDTQCKREIAKKSDCSGACECTSSNSATKVAAIVSATNQTPLPLVWLQLPCVLPIPVVQEAGAFEFTTPLLANPPPSDTSEPASGSAASRAPPFCLV